MDSVRETGTTVTERFTVWTPRGRTGAGPPATFQARWHTYQEACEESHNAYEDKKSRTVKEGPRWKEVKGHKEVTYNHIEKGCDAYVSDTVFLKGQEGWRRKWTTKAGQVTAYQTKEGSLVKRLEKFHAHGSDEESFRDFLREANEYGCHRPSSYPDVFHSSFLSARVHRGVNRLFGPVAHFAWQEAIRPGKHAGHWRRYDINRAYLWASTQGLPVVKSFRYAKDFSGNYPGLYRIIQQDVQPSAPYPFCVYRDVNATSDEIDEYGLRVESVVGGVVWTDNLPSDACTRVIDGMSFGKFVSKSYWGRWASNKGVTCITPGKAWELPDNKQNLVWAHLIVSRVKRRLYEYASTAAHVYVDSIIVPHEIPIGGGLGEWKLEKDYPQGVWIARTGMYGADPQHIDAATGQQRVA